MQKCLELLKHMNYLAENYAKNLTAHIFMLYQELR